jgi:hypothetical protein
VVYNRQVYDFWRRKSDEQFVEDFTTASLEELQGIDTYTEPHLLVRQVLYVAAAKELFRSLAPGALKYANKASWPHMKRHFVNFSPVRRQIKKRLVDEYKIVYENETNKKAAEEWPETIPQAGSNETEQTEKEMEA